MDKRIEKSKAKLNEALKNLLLEKKYSDISIQDILNESKISRSTFYSHYKTKDEILISIIDDIFEHVFSHTLQIEKTHDFSKESIFDYRHLITHILYHLHDNKDMITAIINNDCSSIFYENIRIQLKPLNKQIIKEINLDKKNIPIDLYEDIIGENFIVIMKYWFKNSFKISPETITDYYFEMINN